MADEENAPDTVPPARPAASEPVPETQNPQPDIGYDSGGVPTFEFVREKIETRYGTAVGATGLDADSSAGRRIEEQYEDRQRAAAERIAKIRQSMRNDE